MLKASEKLKLIIENFVLINGIDLCVVVVQIIKVDWSVWIIMNYVNK